MELKNNDNNIKIVMKHINYMIKLKLMILSLNILTIIYI